MISLARKTVASFKQLGFKETLIRIVQYPFRKRIARHRREEFERSILARESIEERFTKIYETNYWGSYESKSGYGSTLESTENIRAVLPELFEKCSIHSVFDAPCGDFNWMRHVLMFLKGVMFAKLEEISYSLSLQNSMHSTQVLI